MLQNSVGVQRLIKQVFRYIWRVNAAEVVALFGGEGACHCAVERFGGASSLLVLLIQTSTCAVIETDCIESVHLVEGIEVCGDVPHDAVVMLARCPARMHAEFPHARIAAQRTRV